MKTHTPQSHIAIFASGNGSNAEAIVRYFNIDHPGRAEVTLIVTNRRDAGVIDRAHNFGIPVAVLTRDEINDPSVMLSLMDSYAIDIVVLAGFLLMIPTFLIDRYPDRIINIHPSLLPRHGGKGMYGRHVHEAVIASGDTVTGITIHRVTPRYDEGAILLQVSTPVYPADTPADIETRVHALEYLHYPRIIATLLPHITETHQST